MSSMSAVGECGSQSNERLTCSNFRFVFLTVDHHSRMCSLTLFTAPVYPLVPSTPLHCPSLHFTALYGPLLPFTAPCCPSTALYCRAGGGGPRDREDEKAQGEQREAQGFIAVAD